MMRRFYLLAAFPLLVLGCLPELDDEPRCRLTADGWVCRDAGTDAGVPTTDAGLVDSGAPADTGALPALDMSNTPPDMAEPEPTATSCAELLARGDSGRGTRTIELGGGEVDVFCDQETDGGGWMLVARSVANGTVTFGWSTPAGSLSDDNSPYAIGRSDFPLSELLIGNRDDAKGWGNRVYRVALPQNFVADCATTPCGTTVSNVAGTCTNPTMFNFAGRTSKTDSFWFRDVDGDNPYGLFPDGWRTFYDDCVGGELNGQQGMIFAR